MRAGTQVKAVQRCKSERGSYAKVEASATESRGDMLAWGSAAMQMQKVGARRCRDRGDEGQGGRVADASLPTERARPYGRAQVHEAIRET
jgi:hypothetical protein